MVDDTSPGMRGVKTASGGQDLRPCTRAIASGGQRILRWTEGTPE